jgi:N-acetylglucosaminyl-diphospho-decaprenol L-rhamnosyltransferase
VTIVKLLIIILNYRTADLTRQAITSAVTAAAHVDDSKIVVVDNDSQDGSLEKLRRAVLEEGVRDRVEVIPSEYNGGFGYGNNFAIRRALASDDVPEYIYLLNSDAFPSEQALAKLVAYMDANDDVGIAGSFIHGLDGSAHRTAFRFPTFWSEFEDAMQLGVLTKLLGRYVVPLPVPEETTQVDWVAGASMLLRTTMLEEIGLFDETFFLYFEETDLCRRARNAGWPVVYVRDSQVAHVGSASTGIQDQRRRKPAFWFDSRQHYFVKNHGPLYLWLANAAQVGGGAVFRARRILQGQRESRPIPDHFLRDLIGHMARTGTRAPTHRSAARSA